SLPVVQAVLPRRAATSGAGGAHTRRHLSTCTTSPAGRRGPPMDGAIRRCRSTILLPSRRRSTQRPPVALNAAAMATIIDPDHGIGVAAGDRSAVSALEPVGLDLAVLALQVGDVVAHDRRGVALACQLH